MNIDKYKLASLAFLLLFFPLLIFALETSYPGMGDYTVDEGSRLGEYISYIAYFLIIVTVFITVFSIVRGGFLWMTAAGDPSKIKDSKEKISNAILGLIIVLGASLFLSSLNPELTEIDDDEREERREIVKEVEPPGFYLTTLSKDNISGLSTIELEERIHAPEGEERVHRIRESVRNLQDRAEGIQTVRIVNQLDRENELTGFYYALILHEDRGYQGRCQVLVNDSTNPKDFTVDGNFYSITAIQVPQEPIKSTDGEILGGVNLYSRPDFRGEEQELSVVTENNDFSFSPLKEELQRRVWSIDILRRKAGQDEGSRLIDGGKFALILSSGENWNDMKEEGGCGVFLTSRAIADLKMHHMNRCDPQTQPPIYSAYRSCSTHYMVFPLYESHIIYKYITEAEND